MSAARGRGTPDEGLFQEACDIDSVCGFLSWRLASVDARDRTPRVCRAEGWHGDESLKAFICDVFELRLASVSLPRTEWFG